jgi:uncharacterized membrane protein YuzA (DUF378 family)
MERPGPVGLTILLAFLIVGAIEFRTLLGMFGVDVVTSLYYPAAALVIGLVVVALFALPSKDSSHRNAV